MRFLDAGPVVMAILNVTPDSFYAASRRGELGDADLCRAVERMATDGAAIIDVGGYSSRPGALPVGVDEEFERVARGVRAVLRVSGSSDILSDFSDIRGLAISVDTFRAEVARRVVEEFGPVIVNDISAGELDNEMISTVARLSVPYIAMHMRGTPATMQSFVEYGDVVSNICEYFNKKINILKTTGVSEVILDPGFGFSKTVEQNYELLHGLHKLVSLGFPVLSGVSRKSMIYKVLGVDPADTLAGTTALNWESLRQGAKILRVHDVREAADVIKIFKKYGNSAKNL